MIGYNVKNIYIGQVQIFNPEALDDAKQIETAFIAMKLVKNSDNTEKYVPLKNYYHFTNLNNIVPIKTLLTNQSHVKLVPLLGTITGGTISEVMKQSGKKEVKVLNEGKGKQLKFPNYKKPTA